MAKRPPKKNNGPKSTPMNGASEVPFFKILSDEDNARLRSSTARIEELAVNMHSGALEIGNELIVCKSLLPTDVMWLKYAESLRDKLDFSTRTIQNYMAAARLRAEHIAAGGNANFAHISISALFLLNGKKVPKSLRDEIFKRSESELISLKLVKAAIAKALKPEAEKPAAKATTKSAKTAVASSNVVSVSVKATPSKPEEMARTEELARLATEAAAEVAKAEMARTSNAPSESVEAPPSETEETASEHVSDTTEQPTTELPAVEQPLGPEHFAREIIKCIRLEKELYGALLAMTTAEVHRCFDIVNKSFCQMAETVQS